MAIWNGCHIRQYSINFDWFYWLSFFTEFKLTIFWSYHRSLTPTPQKNPPGHKTTSIYCISGQKLQLDLTFNSWFSNIHWYYRIHVVTFPYLSELPPNMNEWMNECRSNSQWWLLSRSKHDYGLLNAPGLRSFKDIVNLDTVRRFIVCRSRGNTIPGFICCIFIFTPTTSSRRARSLGWACNGEMTKGGRGQWGKKRKNASNCAIIQWRHCLWRNKRHVLSFFIIKICQPRYLEIRPICCNPWKLRGCLEVDHCV